MKKLILYLFLLPTLCFGQGAHRIGQVIVKGNGVSANVGPYASIKVCTVGTQCSTISPVYSDQSLTHVLPQPLTADASGNYSYYTGVGCVDEQISSPGSTNIMLFDVCPSTGVVGVGSVTSVSVNTANGFQGTVANPTSTPAISLNVDGTHYLPTLTDQTNWNGKQPALGFTPENAANKDAASGYAGLTSGTLLKTSEFPAFTGDASSTAGSTALTLATVNSGPGTCGDATHVCAVTTNAKGLVTSQTSTPISSVSTLSVGNLSPLFTSSVANPTSSPTVTFTQSVAPINSVFAGAPSGSAVAPTFQTSPTFSAANLTNFPTFNQNTTGTASNLSGTPALPNGTTATTQTVGDNSTKLATTAFVLANGGSYVLPQATTSVLGGVKCDGTTITCTSGVISTGVGGGNVSTAGLTAGYLPVASTSTALANSQLDYGVTNASKFTFASPLVVSAGAPGVVTPSLQITGLGGTAGCMQADNAGNVTVGPPCAATAGVTAFNTLTGGVTLSAGSNIALTTVGNNITVNGLVTAPLQTEYTPGGPRALSTVYQNLTTRLMIVTVFFLNSNTTDYGTAFGYTDATTTPVQYGGGCTAPASNGTLNNPCSFTMTVLPNNYYEVKAFGAFSAFTTWFESQP